MTPPTNPQDGGAGAMVEPLWKRLLAKIPLALVAGFVCASYGYDKGQHDGTLEMKCAIFAAMDQVTKAPPETRFSRIGCALSPSPSQTGEIATAGLGTGQAGTATLHRKTGL